MAAFNSSCSHYFISFDSFIHSSIVGVLCFGSHVAQVGLWECMVLLCTISTASGSWSGGFSNDDSRVQELVTLSCSMGGNKVCSHCAMHHEVEIHAPIYVFILLVEAACRPKELAIPMRQRGMNWVAQRDTVSLEQKKVFDLIFPCAAVPHSARPSTSGPTLRHALQQCSMTPSPTGSSSAPCVPTPSHKPHVSPSALTAP